VLVLEDARSFFEANRSARGATAFGEAVFTTSMSGYQEVATDPSFRRPDRLLARAPMVGNYGVAAARKTSQRRAPNAISVIMA